MRTAKRCAAWALTLCLLWMGLTVPPAQAADLPALDAVFPGDDVLMVGTPLTVSFEANMAGSLEVRVAAQQGNDQGMLGVYPVQAGVGQVTWDGTLDGAPVAEGNWEVLLTLVGGEGARSMLQAALVEVRHPAGAAQAAQRTGPSPDRQFSSFLDPHENCSWGLPIDTMDVYDPADQARIWEAMMQPITVLNVGPTDHVYPLIAPGADPKDIANLTGQLHGTTQGVHVLEERDGWSHIEAFSNDGYRAPDRSLHDLGGQLIHGWVKTSQLKVVKPYAKIGLLIDKLTQRLYVFRDGVLYTELLVSTGIPTTSQPWNETPAGEYLVDSWVGQFVNGKMLCDLALRINGGVLLHEVPHRLLGDGSRQYDPYRTYLGQKASHGCVRVQNLRNKDGVNMAWLWKNLKRNTRVLIWDDVGRAPLRIPDAARTMYYNPNGGANYHSDENCASVRERFLPLTPLPYEALFEAPTDKLTPCQGCVPFTKINADFVYEIPDDVIGANMEED